jgi:glutathione S-transferase
MTILELSPQTNPITSISTRIMTNAQNLPILYSFRRCPYAMRARMALIYSQTPLEIREIILRDKPQSMLEKSPKGTVPVLILNEKRLLEESLDIMYWALNKNDPENWLPNDESLKIEVTNLIKQCDDEFKMHLDHYKYADRYPELSATDYRRLGESFLKKLDQQLSTQKFLYGEKISIADIAIFPFIRQFAHVDKAWFDESGYTHLKKWLAQHLASEYFLVIMQKIPQWKEGDQATLFPLCSS